jgi:hypothetical protein
MELPKSNAHLGGTAVRITVRKCVGVYELART